MRVRSRIRAVNAEIVRREVGSANRAHIVGKAHEQGGADQPLQRDRVDHLAIIEEVARAASAWVPVCDPNRPIAETLTPTPFTTAC